MDKVTILTRGGLGNIVVTHAKLVAHGRKPYAQYKSAPFVQFIKKGARKIVGKVFTYDPYLLILEGWQDIKSQELFSAPTIAPNGTKISAAKFALFDKGWEREFESGVEFKNVIADYRGVDTHEIL